MAKNTYLALIITLLLHLPLWANARTVLVCNGIVSEASCSNCCSLEQGCIYLHPETLNPVCVGGEPGACTRECQGPRIKVCPDQAPDGIRETWVQALDAEDEESIIPPECQVVHSLDFVGNSTSFSQRRPPAAPRRPPPPRRAPPPPPRRTPPPPPRRSPPPPPPRRSPPPPPRRSPLPPPPSPPPPSAPPSECLEDAVEVCNGHVLPVCSCCSMPSGCITLSDWPYRSCIPRPPHTCTRECTHNIAACALNQHRFGMSLDMDSCLTCHAPRKPGCNIYSRRTGFLLCPGLHATS